MTKTTNNPWAGLASYEDPAKSGRKLKFCGRDNDIYDVARLIDDNLLLVLYGKSGIGKTSLLNAGVFPKLRLDQYLPVSIRLGTLEANASYQEAVISAIEKAIDEVQGSKTVVNVVEEQTDNQQPDRLWNYFARHRFTNAEGQPLFPVVVLDQFEEVLRNTSPEHVDKAQTLLNQLQYLIDESHALNDSIVDGQEYFYDFNFRFVISIREDELYLLEDSIDDLSLSMFRNCRYRLRSLSEQGATEAILMPGKDCIIEEQKQVVVDRIIELSKRPQSNDIDTLLLSLVCSGTYDKKTGEKITLSDLAVWKSNPMEVYYQDAVNGLTVAQIRYIQQHLIREDGSRRRVDVAEVKAALGEAIYQQLTQGANRLFAIGDKGQVELLHDQLGMAVYEERKNAEEKEKKRKQRQKHIRNVGTLALLVISVISIIALFQFKKLRWKMLENQSRFIAEKAIALAETDSYLARLLAIETLPKFLNDPDRPYTIEAETALREASFNSSAVFKGNGTIKSISCNADSLMVSASSDNTIIVWNIKSGTIVRNLLGHTQIVNSASFNQKGDRIVSASNDSTVRIWDTETGLQIDGYKFSVPIKTAEFSFDGKLALAITSDKNLSIIDIEKHLSHIHIFHNISVNHAHFTKNDQIIMAIGEKMILFDPQTNSTLTIVQDSTFIKAFSISPNEKLIASISETGSIKIWDIEKGMLIWSQYYDDSLNSFNEYNLEFSPNGNNILAAGTETIKIWDIEKKAMIRFFKNASSIATFTPDGKHVAFIPREKKSNIHVKTIIDDKPLNLKGHTRIIDYACFNPNGEHQILSSSRDGTTRIWNSETGACVDYVMGYYAAYNPKGTHFATIYETNIYIWDVNTLRCTDTITINARGYKLAYFPDEPKLIIEADSVAYIYDVERSLCTDSITISNLESYIYEDNNKKYYIYAYGDNIRIWNVSKQPSIDSKIICYNSNGKLALKQQGHQTFLINAITGSCIADLGICWHAKFGPDDRVMVCRDGMMELFVWDSNTNGFYSLPYRVAGSPLALYDFSADGKYILTGWMEQGNKWDELEFSIIVIYCPPLQELINQTRERFKDRPLTPEERRMYYLE